LFAVIGTTYGSGDGSTTFNLPDLRGRVAAGLDNMGGSDANRLDWPNTLGTAGGEQKHLLTGNESGVKAHGHTASSGDDSPDHSHRVVGNTGDTDTGGYRINYLSDSDDSGAGLWMGRSTDQAAYPPHSHYLDITSWGASARHQHAVTVNNAALSDATYPHNIMQPTILMNYIIRVA